MRVCLASGPQTSKPAKQSKLDMTTTTTTMDQDPLQPNDTMLPEEPELRAIYVDRWMSIRTHHKINLIIGMLSSRYM